MRIDEERLREDLFDSLEERGAGGCGQHIVLMNAIACADAERLQAIARDMGFIVRRYDLDADQGLEKRRSPSPSDEAVCEPA